MKRSKNKNQNNSNKDMQRIALGSIALGVVSVNLILALAMNNSNGTIMEVNKILPIIGYYYLVCGLLFLICSILVFGILWFLNKDIFKTYLHLMAKKITAKQLCSNTNIVTPCLQMFLYEVLKKNKEITLLPVGKDMSCLSPDTYYLRENCVFYRFKLTSTQPEYDNNQLKEIIQGLINSELNSFGIINLSPIYNSKTMNCYSVYIDSIFYDGENNCVIFDMLYICTENSAKYFQKAVNRNTKSVENKVIYDDEI